MYEKKNKYSDYLFSKKIKRTNKRTNMQNICFEKPKRPLDEQIFGTKNKDISMYVAKKNKYSDYLFGSQTTGEQIFRTDIRAAFDKRTNM